MSSNNNVNNNIAQIIFPKDVEIRKVKKRKPKSKSKSNANKKRSISDLKTTLKEFDLTVDTAQQNNIDLPEALGQLPNDIDNLNTIKEIVALTQNLRNRIRTINQYIMKHSQNRKLNDFFNEGTNKPSPSGVPVFSGVFPPLPATPTVIQQQPNSNNVEEQLNQIETEVKQKLAKSGVAIKQENMNTEDKEEVLQTSNLRRPMTGNILDESPQYKPQPSVYVSNSPAYKVLRNYVNNTQPIDTTIYQALRDAGADEAFISSLKSDARPKLLKAQKKFLVKNYMISRFQQAKDKLQSSTPSPIPFPKTSPSPPRPTQIPKPRKPTQSAPRFIQAKTYEEYLQLLEQYRGVPNPPIIQAPSQNLMNSSSMDRSRGNLAGGLNPFRP